MSDPAKRRHNQFQEERAAKRKTLFAIEFADLSAEDYEFAVEMQEIYYEIFSNTYRREPDAEGRWPCAACYEYKRLDEYYTCKGNPNGRAWQCIECFLARKKAYYAYRRAHPIVEKPTPREGHKFCTKCGIEKPLTEYHKDSRKKSGYYSACKTCKNESTRTQSKTLVGAFRAIYDGCLARSLERGQGPSQLTMLNIAQIYERQRGRCAISGIKLTWEPHSKFKLSPERIRNDETYTMENTTLIICQLNTTDQTKGRFAEHATGSAQWTSQKWIDAHHLRCNSFSDTRDQELRQRLFPIKIKRDYFPKPLFNSACGQFRECKGCHATKPLAEFVEGQGKCKICKLQSRKINRFLSTLMRNMRTRSSQRHGEQCNLVIEDLRQLILRQNGLCAISKIPMSFQHMSNWQCSVDRKNNLKGYMLDNIQLVCLEFQSADHSRALGVNLANVVYTAQWTVDLYMEVFWPNGGSETPEIWTSDNSYGIKPYLISLPDIV
jgi:hypothetical protein